MRTNEDTSIGSILVMGLLPDALMCGGAAAISYGANLIYAPAGFIVGGLFVLAAGVLLALGDE